MAISENAAAVFDSHSAERNLILRIHSLPKALCSMQSKTVNLAVSTMAPPGKGEAPLNPRKGVQPSKTACFQVKRIAQEKGCIFCVYPFFASSFPICFPIQGRIKLSAGKMQEDAAGFPEIRIQQNGRSKLPAAAGGAVKASAKSIG